MLDELPTPALHDDEVLVRVETVGVNFPNRPLHHDLYRLTAPRRSNVFNRPGSSPGELERAAAECLGEFETRVAVRLGVEAGEVDLDGLDAVVHDRRDGAVGQAYAYKAGEGRLGVSKTGPVVAKVAGHGNAPGATLSGCALAPRQRFQLHERLMCPDQVLLDLIAQRPCDERCLGFEKQRTEATPAVSLAAPMSSSTRARANWDPDEILDTPDNYCERIS